MLGSPWGPWLSCWAVQTEQPVVTASDTGQFCLFAQETLTAFIGTRWAYTWSDCPKHGTVTNLGSASKNIRYEFIPMTVIQVRSKVRRCVWTWVTGSLPHALSRLFPAVCPSLHPHHPSSFHLLPSHVSFLCVCFLLPSSFSLSLCVLDLLPSSPLVFSLPFSLCSFHIPDEKLPNSESECIWISCYKFLFNYSNVGPKDILGCNSSKGHFLAEFHTDRVSCTQNISPWSPTGPSMPACLPRKRFLLPRLPGSHWRHHTKLRALP